MSNRKYFINMKYLIAKINIGILHTGGNFLLHKDEIYPCEPSDESVYYTKVYSTILDWVQIRNDELQKYFYTEQEIRKLKLEKLKNYE